MAKLKDWLKINDSGILKNVAKRKRQRDVTMLEAFWNSGRTRNVGERT